MDSLFKFIEQQCIKYNIDESHGLKHAKGTMERAYMIIKTMKNSSNNEETRVALFSAALHDMCDSKYCPVEDASRDIEQYLLSVRWSRQEIAAVLNIITSMSYSKLKKYRINGKIEFPEHGKWQRAYHIARNADLLEGFIVARCVLYNKHIYPLKTEDEHWQRAIELFNERVFTYVLEGWINLPEALVMAPSLEQEARRCLTRRLMDWPEPCMNKVKIEYEHMLNYKHTSRKEKQVTRMSVVQMLIANIQGLSAADRNAVLSSFATPTNTVVSAPMSAKAQKAAAKAEKAAAKAEKKPRANAGVGTAWAAFCSKIQLEHKAEVDAVKLAAAASRAAAKEAGTEAPKDTTGAHLHWCSKYKAEHEAEWLAYKATWEAEHPKAEHPKVVAEAKPVVTGPSDAEASEPEASGNVPEKPKRVMTDEQKAKMKAGREAAKAKKAELAAGSSSPKEKAE
jgi:hypothetical protein